jgi:hypothetical protein
MKKCNVCEKTNVEDSAQLCICIDCWINLDCGCGLEKL